ncbi:hypothetical protein HYT00_00740 [Candidatus Giovannonibacteria bacterium]|nr:hypothetical protein [Candidatus Giovannonibacteria bacterium]
MPRNLNKLAEALNLEKLPENDREEILKKVDERLNEVLISVLVSNISDEDAVKIQNALHEGVDLEETVAQIAVRVPGLADKIEHAISEEILRLRTVLGVK